MNHVRARRWVAGAVVTTLLGGLLSLLVVSPAAANHGDRVLEVFREFSSTSESTITLTARVQNPDGSPAADLGANEIEIDWEIEGLAVDGESGAASPESPDDSCSDATAPTLGSLHYQCTITINKGGALGTGRVRAWIDHDQDGGEIEADLLEGRLSSEDSDCETEQAPPQGTNQAATAEEDYDACIAAGPEQPGDPNKTEPDDTDVVQIAFVPVDANPQLDCPERSLAPAGETGYVACKVTDQAGRPLSGIHVDGERYGNADAKEAPADYNGDNGDTECVSGADGTCLVVVPHVNANTGDFPICFWIDGDHDDDNDSEIIILNDPSFGADTADGGECAAEPAPEAADTPTNDTDRVILQRQLRVRTAVNLEPESSSKAVGTSHTVTARVLDQFGAQWPTADTVRLEFLAGSIQDTDGSTPGVADRSCTTPGTGDNPGTCTFSYSSSSPGTDTICGWIGGTPSATCNNEAQNADTSAPVDVVVQRWTAAATTPTTQPTAEDVAKTQGYTLVGADGGIFNYGTSTFHGSTGAMTLNKPVIGMANKKGSTGYWLVASDGGIFTFGDAEFYGSMGDQKLNAPILGMEATPSGKGYFLFAADGGIFTFGDAVFKGSTGDLKLNQPVVGMAVTTKGDGYWLVARDGGIFSFNAPFHGSTGDIRLNQPIFDMGSRPGDAGYWLVARDGGIFTFGDAEFYNSAVGATSNQVIGLGVTPTGKGYWIADSRGAVFPFGDARFLGDRRDAVNNAATVGFATVPK